MGRSFAITSLINTLEVAPDKPGEVTFTVTNKGGRPLKGMARIIPIDATRAEWVAICDGEPERAFEKDVTLQYKVKITVPADTPKGTYTFRMDFASSEDPDGDSTQGPAIAVKLAGAPAPAAPSKFPWWILIVVGAVVLIGGIVTIVVLTTGGPKMVAVPELVGKTLEEANVLAEEAGLTTQLGEELDKPPAKPGTVVEQKPAKGEQAEKGSAIVISAQKAAGPPPPSTDLVDVPDVRKQSIEKAKLMLFEKGFTPKEGAAVFKGGPPGLVIDQTPAPGAKAARSSEVTFIPEAESIVVPDVRNKTVEAALLALQNAKLETQLASKVKAGAAAGLVFEQKPGPGERAQAGTTVVIYVPQAPAGKFEALPYRTLERLQVDQSFRMMLANSITGVKPDSTSPLNVISGTSFAVTFSYTTTLAGKGSVHVQPLTKGVRTPGSTEFNQGLGAAKGDVRALIAVTVKQATHVDSLWIRILDANKQQVAEAKVPVQIQIWPRK